MPKSLERKPASAWGLDSRKTLGILHKQEREKEMNSLDKILAAMRTGKYGSVVDTKGNVHVGLINCIMREDGSGRNWIVTLTNRTVNERVFIHAT
jgi:hypothetical protein